MSNATNRSTSAPTSCAKRTATETITEMVARWKQLDEAGTAFASTMDGSEAPEYSDICNEMTDLENRIVATPAATPGQLAAKRRFIKKTKFIDEAGGDFDTGDLAELVEMILRLDAEHVGVPAGTPTCHAR